MAKKRAGGKNYVPAISQMAYSGVHQRELQQQLDWLRAHGAKDIITEPDESLYDDPGPWWIIRYVR